MKRHYYLILTLTLALGYFPAPSSAEEQIGNLFLFDQDPGWYRMLGRDSVSIVVYDEISDGCWTNIEATTNAVKIELIRSGYKVVDGAPSFIPVIQLYGSGREDGGGRCVITTALSLFIDDMGIYYSMESGVNSSITTTYRRRLLTSSYIMSGTRSSSNRRIKEAFVEHAQNILIEIDARSREAISAIAEQPDGPAKRYWMERLEGL